MEDCSVTSVCFIFFVVSFVLQEGTKMLPREEGLVIATMYLTVFTCNFETTVIFHQ